MRSYWISRKKKQEIKKKKRIQWSFFMVIILLGNGPSPLDQILEEKLFLETNQSQSLTLDEAKKDFERNKSYFLSPDPSEYILDTPINNGCGPISLAMVINYLSDQTIYNPHNTNRMLSVVLGKLPINISSLFPQWGNNKGATMPWGLVAASNFYTAFLKLPTGEDFNYKAEGSNHNSLDNLTTTLRETENPVIALVQYPHGLHWLVVVGYDQDTIWTFDPQYGNDLVIYDRSYFETWFTSPIIVAGIPTYQGYMIQYFQKDS